LPKRLHKMKRRLKPYMADQWEFPFVCLITVVHRLPESVDNPSNNFAKSELFGSVHIPLTEEEATEIVRDMRAALGE